jgi:hypothetical protein
MSKPEYSQATPFRLKPQGWVLPHRGGKLTEQDQGAFRLLLPGLGDRHQQDFVSEGRQAVQTIQVSGGYRRKISQLPECF